MTEPYLQAYLIDGIGTKMALLKVPMLTTDGLPDVPYTIECNGWFGRLSNTNPLTYRWIGPPITVDVIMRY